MIDRTQRDLFKNLVGRSLPDNTLDQFVKHIRQSLAVDDVFTHEQLAEWAYRNGWVERE